MWRWRRQVNPNLMIALIISGFFISASLLNWARFSSRRRSFYVVAGGGAQWLGCWRFYPEVPRSNSSPCLWIDLCSMVVNSTPSCRVNALTPASWVSQCVFVYLQFVCVLKGQWCDLFANLLAFLATLHVLEHVYFLHVHPCELRSLNWNSFHFIDFSSFIG